MYKYKLNKYKLKYKNSTNLVGGKRDCDIAIADNHLENAIMKNDVNLVPFEFERSIYEPIKSQPVCSYSIMDRQHNLYIPTHPNNNDLVFKYLNYYVRPYQILYDDIVVDGRVMSHGGTKNEYILWSDKHQKWYLFDTFPRDDNTFEKLAKDMNIEVLIDPNPEPQVLPPDERTAVMMYLIPALAKFLLVKNIVRLLPGDYFDPLEYISFLLEEATSTRYAPNNIEFNTAAPGYIRELEEINKTLTPID